jgi:2,3-dihydroxybenzoate decarboxylase
VAPQDPKAAVKEMDRAVRTLGLKGVIINSHTRGEHLDDPKFWDIFGAAEALKVPIYIHPQGPPPAMIGPYVERGLEGALWGFAAETGLHALGIIRSGALDRFPGLRIVLGHLGEALPFWLFRLDYMNKTARPGIRNGAASLEKPISEYMKENIFVTTSGMAWSPAITFVQSVLGMDRVLYAMDYPYQFEPDEVTATDQVPIGDADKKKLFQTNAERVFSL